MTVIFQGPIKRTIGAKLCYGVLQYAVFQAQEVTHQSWAKKKIVLPSTPFVVAVKFPEERPLTKRIIMAANE